MPERGQSAQADKMRESAEQHQSDHRREQRRYEIARDVLAAMCASGTDDWSPWEAGSEMRRSAEHARDMADALLEALDN